VRYAPILVQAPLKASHEYHLSLEALESAHIRNELKAIFRLWAGLEAATQSRDSALTALHSSPNDRRVGTHGETW